MNLELQNTIAQLKDKAIQSKFWKRVMHDLKKPTRQRRTVNLYKINKYAKEGETVLVPGKVLSVGDLDKKVDVVAYQFSAAAKEKILKNKGNVLSINELLAKNPEAKKVRILG